MWQGNKDLCKSEHVLLPYLHIDGMPHIWHRKSQPALVKYVFGGTLLTKGCTNLVLSMFSNSRLQMFKLSLSMNSFNKKVNGKCSYPKKKSTLFNRFFDPLRKVVRLSNTKDNCKSNWRLLRLMAPHVRKAFHCKFFFN